MTRRPSVDSGGIGIGDRPPENGGRCGGDRSSKIPRASVIVKCVWLLAKPGNTALPDPSMRSASGNRARISSFDPIAVIRLPSIAMARSEEHTSEHQSLMRISYAVFCLKKKKIDT